MPSLEVCSACNHTIEDKFLLRLMNHSWHERCVLCCICRKTLTGTCFTRNRKLYCRDDYEKQFIRKCNACSEKIYANELIMRANSFVYHMRCFTCVVCRQMLQTGDQFVIQDGDVICREDFEREFGYLPQTFMSDDDDSYEDDDVEMSRPQKRPRTILTTSQRRKFKLLFESNPKPCRKMREGLAAETGLSVRVVQVWFQNQRAKMKKMARKPTDNSDSKSDQSKDTEKDAQSDDISSEDDTKDTGCLTESTEPREQGFTKENRRNTRAVAGRIDSDTKSDSTDISHYLPTSGFNQSSCNCVDRSESAYFPPMLNDEKISEKHPINDLYSMQNTYFHLVS